MSYLYFRYLGDDSMERLVNGTRDCPLEILELSDNGTITDAGLGPLARMTKLKRLRLEALPGVSDPTKALEEIKLGLPNCEVIWPPHTKEEKRDGA